MVDHNNEQSYILNRGKSMAQKLKNELKILILEETKKEILENGFENASIRNIAKKCDISVGNIYRYYENKDDLFKCTYKNFLSQISDLILMYSKNRFAIFTKFHINKLFDVNQLIDEFTEGLMNIIMENKEEALILFINKKEIEKILLWFSDTLEELDKRNKDKLYYKMCANGIINSISYALNNSDDNEEISRNIILYLKDNLN